MKSSVTKAFRKKLDGLPASVQEQAAKAYAISRLDPYHNSLQFKQVSQRQPIYSVRVILLTILTTSTNPVRSLICTYKCSLKPQPPKNKIPSRNYPKITSRRTSQEK
jgi:hypothetical protein